MEKRVQRLRREVSRVARGTPVRSRRYPERLRQEAVAVLEHRQKRGEGLRSTARLLGLTAETLRYWCRQQRNGGLRPVQVAAEAPRPAEDPSRLILVTPGGYRVEGLALAQVVELVRVLG
jgi:transposase-like protein